VVGRGASVSIAVVFSGAAVAFWDVGGCVSGTNAVEDLVLSLNIVVRSVHGTNLVVLSVLSVCGSNLVLSVCGSNLVVDCVQGTNLVVVSVFGSNFVVLGGMYDVEGGGVYFVVGGTYREVFI
jgi:hypothetical protein